MTIGLGPVGSRVPSEAFIDGRPSPELTLAELPNWAAQRYGDRPAVSFEGVSLSYRELAQQVGIAAAGLTRMGIKPGDRVGLWMENNSRWVLAYFALAKIGAVIVPINTRLRATEVGYVVEHSGCSTIIIGAEVAGKPLLKVALEVCSRPGSPVMRVVGDIEPALDGADSASTGPELIRWSDVVTAVVSTDVPATDATATHVPTTSVTAIKDGDLAMLLYTSGTTGFPKGVMHCHRVIRNMTDLAERMRFGPDDRLLVHLPLFHVFANFAGLLAPLVAGSSIHLMNGFRAPTVLDVISAGRITVEFGVPTTYLDLRDEQKARPRDLSSLRLCFAPGAPYETEAVDREIGFAVNIYGMTETTSTTSVSALDEPIEIRTTRVGRPLAGSSLRILDEHGVEVALGEVGEIAVKGDPVMMGYYRDPDSTAAVLDEMGWFRTGDLGTLDINGYLSFAGRARDMIKVGGENVDPTEVEMVAATFPGVERVAVIGVPDARLVEVPCAYIIESAPVDHDQLISYLRERVASFKAPRYVRVVPEFPMTASGKVQKAQLQEWFIG